MISTKGISENVLLVILDGFGLSENKHKNAIRDAQTPFIDELFSHSPMTSIEAGGVCVGLPKGVPGNSEVGHMNLGAGRAIRQDLVRINESIQNKSFKDLPLLRELKEKALKGSRRVHIMGLLSDGGVHSHIDHIKEVINSLNDGEDLQIFFHAFMDGRDTKKNIGHQYISDLQKVSGFKFASMQGRSIGMDRDRRWEKIKHCYETMIGKGKTTSLSPSEYIQEEYQNEIYDEFITPVLFDKEAALRSDDSVFFINFRPDRAIQLSLALTDPKFKEFERPIIPSYFLCMTPYIPDEVPLPILFDKERVEGGLSEYLSELGHSQYKIAETEKYAHITFFFNGGEKTPYPKEDQVLIPSPQDIATYDERPEMSAFEVTERLEKALDENKHKFYLVNFANSDMVGHTGNYQAAVKAIEAIDTCVGRLMKKVKEKKITMLLTADHGNSDEMAYKDGSPHTSHTGAPVPFCLYHENIKSDEVEFSANSSLKDVAPTILHLMGIVFPPKFEGQPIFK